MVGTMESILTLDDAAELLKVSEDVIQGLLESGEIPGRQIGGEWRTTTRAIVSYVDGVPLQMSCCTTDASGMCCVPATEGSNLCCQPAPGNDSGCC
jgi:excisionase family DNA binding protein